MTNADRQKRYRDRQRIAGKSTSGKSGASAKWDNAQFIAIDGEGENIGKVEKYVIEKREYKANEHVYTLLAASTGESLFAGGKRLDSISCIDFLLDLAICYKQAIFVIFAGGYDINHMLMWGFERADLQKIGRGETFEWRIASSGEEIIYSIEYRARKSLTLRRGLNWKEDKNGKWQKKWTVSMTLWDVFGYFQENFVGVMRKWLGEDHKHFALIKEMKKLRGDFADIAQARINAYNAAELECLNEIMVKLHSAIDGLDLKCRRWDGAGSIAAALMQKHEIKSFKACTPEDMEDKVRTAYAGGRIEVCKIGVHHGRVYDYDINSAYPFVMADLPCLAHGQWSRGTGIPPGGFTLVHCVFDFADDLPFYPLFYRNEHMQICFPRSGEGIYWLPEYLAADECPGTLEVIEWWHFKPDCHHKPFHWIKDYYETRKLWVSNPQMEWQRGGEKIIKLGLNSLYGKTAQQLGGRDGNPPAYHQMEWAGFITSQTRARLYLAASQSPDAVIGFATDGIFTDRPLKIELSQLKGFGAWSLKTPVPCGITIAMAGVYWWHKEGGGFEHFSRGFDKDAMQTPERIIRAWSSGEGAIDIPMQRLIGIGSACASDTLWKMRGRFTQGVRSLRIDGESHKRHGFNVKKAKPHLQLVDMKPQDNFDYEQGLQQCSHPYPLDWLEGDGDVDYQKSLELIKELEDTLNI